jgi:putative sigma-54 modulation protein
MKIVIHTPKILAQESLLTFVKEKVQKLSLFTDEIQEAQITLKLRNAAEPENKTCEIRGVVSGSDLYAEKHAATFEEAALKAVDALKRQIADWKGKTFSRPDLSS